MKIYFKVSVILGAVLCQTGFQSGAFAGGMTIGDQGTHAEGRSGAFTAKADDISAMEYNPAGLTNIGGTQFYLDNRFGYAVEAFQRASSTQSVMQPDGSMMDYNISYSKVKNEHPWQLLDPMLGAGSNFGLKSWAFAIGAYAPPGVATQRFPGRDKTWIMEEDSAVRPENGGQRFMLMDRDVKILYYDLSVAWKFRDLFGLGASLQWVDLAQIRIRLAVNGNTSATVQQPDGGTFDMIADISGADHVGFSGILGAWVKPLPFLQIALSGRIAPTPLKADCKLDIEADRDINDAGMTMTRNGVPANDVTLSMKLPPTARLGVRYIHLKEKRELFDVEADFVYEAWHVMDRYEVDGNNLDVDIDGPDNGINRNTQPIRFDKIYIDKNWKDTFSVRLGGDYNVIDKWLTLRAGTFFESGANNAPYSYMDFYSSHRLGGSLGASVKFFGVDIGLSYTYIYEFPFSVTEQEGKVYQQIPARADDVDPLAGPVANAGDYNSHFHFGSVSVSYTF